MDEIKFDWDDLRLFLAVAREGGLAGAVNLTGKSAPTLGRRMLALERRLNMELFERMPQGYSLTEQGHALLSRVAELEYRVLPIEAAAKSAKAPVIKISAGTWVTHLLCGQVDHLIGGDEVTLRFISADHVLNIAHREAIIGVRNQRPEQAGLVCRRITRVRFAVYAANKDVKNWARVIGTTPSAQWLIENIADKPSIELTNARNALDLALAGMARAVLPTFIGDGQDRLMQVSPTIKELEHDQWLVLHQEDRFLPQVRRTIDRIYSVLRQKIS